MFNWRKYYNPELYNWDKMWDTTQSTGAVARPHRQLYMGRYGVAISKKVVAVVNVAEELQNYPYAESVNKYKIGLPDPGAHRSEVANFISAVSLVVQLIESHNYTILVHCASGMSRCVAVSSTAIAMLNNTTVLDEIKRIAKERPEIYPEHCYVVFGELLNGELTNEGE